MKFEMTLHRIIVDGEFILSDTERSCHGIYVVDGSVAINDTTYDSCQACFAHGATSISGDGTILNFAISPFPRNSKDHEEILNAHFEHDQNEMLVRLDKVTFPPGARAYRHIHPGPGIRHLISGKLEIKSDHDVIWMEKGSAWFEAANSPVQATAANVPETSFIRMLVLPVEFEGKPTIKLLDPSDETLPKRQGNNRFFDERVQLPSFKRSSSDR